MTATAALEIVRVLHLEDDERDAEAVRAALVEGGFLLEYLRVDTADAFLSALDAFLPDLVISEFGLPSLDGSAAVRIVRRRLPDTPVLFVSDTRGEGAAVTALRLGAVDFLAKDRLGRLPSAVRLALDAADARRRSRDAEEEVRRSEERLRRFMDASPNVAFMRDGDGRIVYANEAIRALVGRDLSEVIGRTIFELFPESVARSMHETDADVLGGGRSVETTFEYAGTDGLVRNWSVIKFPLPDVTGRMLIAGIAVDVTERRRLEGRYLHAQKLEAVGRLAGGVAHDFNNLLTVINGYAQMIEAAHPGDETLVPYLAEIRLASERGSALTRQLLAFSRQEVAQPVVLAVNDVIAGMDRIVRRLVGEEVRLEIQPDPAIGCVTVDKGQLEQIVMNLVVNARDATEPGGVITLRTSEVPWSVVAPIAEPGAVRGPYVVVTVEDTGSGMSAETRARIFEPFFTTKERGKGTGLGLATVHGIVRQHGGCIGVRTALGVGSAFDVYFPRTESDDCRRVRSSVGTTDAPPGGSESVLVAEDNETVRSLVGRILEHHGYRVTLAQDGIDAIQKLRDLSGKLDLLVTDIVMPRLGGSGLAELVAGSNPGCPVLFLSGYADHESARRVETGPGRDLLKKPFAAPDLLRRVRALLDARATTPQA